MIGRDINAIRQIKRDYKKDVSSSNQKRFDEVYDIIENAVKKDPETEYVRLKNLNEGVRLLLFDAGFEVTTAGFVSDEGQYWKISGW